MGSRIETTHRRRASIGGEKAAGEKGSLPARRLPMAMQLRPRGKNQWDLAEEKR